MAVPTHIAVVPTARHDGTRPVTGTGPVQILNIGTSDGGTYTLTDVDVPAGAMILPLSPVTGVAGSPFAVQAINEEPVITASNGAVSVTIASGPHAGTYTQDIRDNSQITVADIEAGPVPYIAGHISGLEVVGQTLTYDPVKWLYAGNYPGDPTFAWRNDADGATGEVTETYTVVSTDLGDTLSVDETFDGVTISSASTGTITAAPGQINILARDTASDPTNNTFASTPSTVSFDVGAAATGKRIYIAAASFIDSTGSLELSMTLDGQNMTRLSSSFDGGPDLEVFFIDSDTMNGTVDCVLTPGTGVTRSEIGYVMWAVTGIASHQFEEAYQDGGITRLSVDIDVPSNGAIFTAAASPDNTGALSILQGANNQFAEVLWRTGEKTAGADQTGLGAETARTVEWQSTTDNANPRMSVMAISLTPA